MVEWSSRAQTSVSFCGGFYGGWNVEFGVGKGFYSFGNTVVIDGGRTTITGREPVLFRGRVDVNGAVDGGAVVVDGGGAVANGGDWTVGRSDGI